MSITLLEKARAGRIAALASLDTRPDFSESEVLHFDLGFVAKRQKPTATFVSQRPRFEENLFAA